MLSLLLLLRRKVVIVIFVVKENLGMDFIDGGSQLLSESGVIGGCAIGSSSLLLLLLWFFFVFPDVLKVSHLVSIGISHAECIPKLIF